MFVFASSVTKPDVYAACAEPGIRRVAEDDALIWALENPGTLFEGYNQLLDRAAKVEGLEGLVLLHHDTEIVSADFMTHVRAALSDPDVGVVGCVGAVGVRTVAWWDGSVTLASFLHRYDEHGGGDLPGSSWAWEDAPASARFGEVDTVDGFLLVLSPWVVQNVRFDESLGQLHGYDFDFCLQVREAGRKVVTADVRAVHNHSLDLVSKPERGIGAHIQIAAKGDGRVPGAGWAAGTWEERARRAEAERDLFLARASSNELRVHAEIPSLERAIAEARSSISWRLTKPVRAMQRLGGSKR